MTPSKSKAGQVPILVIEDEASVMAFVKAAMERAGYHIVSANNGAAGLKMLESGDYMGVITDMRMPGGVSGADVHAWLKKNRPELIRKLVFITGDTVNDETIRILKETQAPCLEKPFRVSQLMHILQKVFGKPE